MTEEEFQKVYNTPNSELSNETLREKMLYLLGIESFLRSDGVDVLADKRLNEALFCQKELDERAGIFGKKYAFIDLSKYSIWRKKKRKRRKRKKRHAVTSHVRTLSVSR